MNNIESDFPITSTVLPKNYKLNVRKLKEICIAIEMPRQGLRTFGCMNCDFRGTPLCDYHIPRGTGISFVDLGISFHTICEKRYWYILSTYSGTSKHPAYKEILSDYNRSLIQDIVSDIKLKMCDIDTSINAVREKMNKYTPNDELYFVYNDELQNLLSDMNHMQQHFIKAITEHEKMMHHDRELDIRSKDSEHFRKHLSLSDIHRYMMLDLEQVTSSSIIELDADNADNAVNNAVNNAEDSNVNKNGNRNH